MIACRCSSVRDRLSPPQLMPSSEASAPGEGAMMTARALRVSALLCRCLSTACWNGLLNPARPNYRYTQSVLLLRQGSLQIPGGATQHRQKQFPLSVCCCGLRSCVRQSPLDVEGRLWMHISAVVVIVEG